MAEKKKKTAEAGGSSPSLGGYAEEMKRMEKRFQYLENKDRRHGKVNYSALDTTEILGEETVPDLEAETVEDLALANVMALELRKYLTRLTKKEREVLYLIYYVGFSERQAVRYMALHYMTVHTCKVRALEKLKKMLEK